MSNRVLLTGASGFIGRHCLAPLCAAGYEVHAVSSRERSTERPEAQWHRADLLDKSQLDELVTRIKPTHLLHFAWYAIPGKYPTSSENLRWCQSTLELLHSFADNGGKRAVFAGTCFEYDSRYGFCNEELTPSRPSTFYGVCKNSTREVVAGFSRQFGISSAWGRIFYLFGPHESEARLVPATILALLRGQNVPCSHGRPVRDFLHVEHTASLIGAATRIQREVSPGASENKVVHGDDLERALACWATGDYVPTARGSETSSAYADDFPADVAECLVLVCVCGVVLVRLCPSSWGVVLDGDTRRGDEQVWEDVEGTPSGRPDPDCVRFL